ncbi:MAG: sensor histidine kinase [Bryobacteraceae bacterium]
MSASPAAKPDIPGLCRPIAEASPMPMAALEGPGRIVRYVNPAFCRLLGKTSEELIGNPISDIRQPYIVWPIAGADADFAQVSDEAEIQRTVAVNEALLIATVRQHALTEAASADIRQFSFAASHDLREPLRMIASYSQLLARRYRDQLDDRARSYIDQIGEGVERMGNLLDDLLSYAGLGAEEEPADSIDLNAVLAEALQNLEIAIAESGGIVAVGELPTIKGRNTHFVQLFQNLIGNAIKYRGDDPPRIHVSAGKVNGEWRFAVADNGMGIAPEYREQIFGIFKRLHGKEIPGTGMGLAICKRVVERYGGRIWAESSPEQGATFYFTLEM